MLTETIFVGVGSYIEFKRRKAREKASTQSRSPVSIPGFDNSDLSMAASF
jgi:hypothetical protein